MKFDIVHHPIIENPWEYHIIDFHYTCEAGDTLEHYIDLSLKKDSVVRKLRFYGPRNLIIEQGFPLPTHGMEIWDVSNRGLENIGVEVSDFEASHGSITFVAKEVVELD
jgi:hypothetical protein